MTLLSVLDFLKFLNELNNSVDRKKVPHIVFYIHELSELTDVRGDYIRWLADTDKKGVSSVFNFEVFNTSDFHDKFLLFFYTGS